LLAQPLSNLQKLLQIKIKFISVKKEHKSFFAGMSLFITWVTKMYIVFVLMIEVCQIRSVQ